MGTLTGSAAVVAAVIALSAAGAPPALEQRLAGADGWVAWRVPMRTVEPVCCLDGWDRGTKGRQGCTLGRSGVRETTFGTVDGSDALAAPAALVVYARVEGGRVHDVLGVGDSCPVHAAAGVRPIESTAAESIALLARLVADRDPQGSDQLLHALALHRDSGATAALIGLVTGSGDLELRREALFWLGHARGVEGLAAARRIARDDRDAEVRSHALFAMSQSDVPERFAALREAVAQERDADVRHEGYQWVAESGDPGARSWLESALARERDEDGVKAVVFALSELPGGQGVDALVALARRADAAPAVRREALFWLGQSDDPRALRVLEEILGD